MKNTIIIKIIGSRTIRYIKYLQKKGISFLLDKEGNAIDISNKQEMVKAWQNRPVELLIKDREAIYYKGKYYTIDNTICRIKGE